jgi:hypothetical protein
VSPGRGENIPIACTLDAAAMPDRLAEWRSTLGHVVGRTRLGDGGLRLVFDTGIEPAELAGLAAAEQRCCAFFSFAITVDQRGTGLEVRVPDGASDVVAALFGQPEPAGR